MVLIISRNSVCAARKYVVVELLVGKIYQMKGKKYTKGLLLLTFLNWMPSILKRKCRIIHNDECKKHNKALHLTAIPLRFIAAGELGRVR